MARKRLAYVRVLEPLLAARDSGFIERHWSELRLQLPPDPALVRERAAPSDCRDRRARAILERKHAEREWARLREFVIAGLAHERILLDRAPDEQRVQEVLARDGDWFDERRLNDVAYRLLKARGHLPVKDEWAAAAGVWAGGPRRARRPTS